MPVTLTNMDIGTRYALQEDFDNGFVGRDRQVVIQTDDPKGYRPIIMDGQTQGGKSKVALTEDLKDYAKNSELQSAVADLQDQISEPNPDWGTVGAVEDNNMVQVSMLKANNSTLGGYTGVNAQLVFNTDTKRFNIMDGSTAGGIGQIATIADLESKLDVSTYNADKDTFATKTELGAKLDSSTASSTYATKTELNAKADASSVPVLQASTTDLTAGSSPLATGTYYFVYE